MFVLHGERFAFPDGKGRWQVSTDGGTNPVWSADGTKLFFQDVKGSAIYAADVTTEPSVRFGMPELILDADSLELALPSGWSVSADGQRFVTLRADVADADPGALSVIEHWFEEYRGR